MLLEDGLEALRAYHAQAKQPWCVVAPTMIFPDEPPLRCLPDMASHWCFLVDQHPVVTLSCPFAATWLAKQLFPITLVFDFGTHGFETNDWTVMGHHLQRLADTSTHTRTHLSSLLDAYDRFASAHGTLSFLPLLAQDHADAILLHPA